MEFVWLGIIDRILVEFVWLGIMDRILVEFDWLGILGGGLVILVVSEYKKNYLEKLVI